MVQSKLMSKSRKSDKFELQATISNHQKSNIFNVKNKDNSSYAGESDYEQLSQYESHQSNIFNQSNLSNVISLNNKSLANSKHSLRNSRNSFGEEIPNYSQKMRSSSRVKQGKEVLAEYENDEEIISQ